MASAQVTVSRGSRSVAVPATLGDDGRWRTAPRSIRPGASAVLAPGGVVDVHGETNREPSNTVTAPPL